MVHKTDWQHFQIRKNLIIIRGEISFAATKCYELEKKWNEIIEKKRKEKKRKEKKRKEKKRKEKKRKEKKRKENIRYMNKLY